MKKYFTKGEWALWGSSVVLESLAHEDGYCVIIVTHDDTLGKKADVVIRMQDGQLV